MKELRDVRVVLPLAPTRKVAIMESEVASWFDIKFRSDKSFLVDFDEAFSRKEVEDSYERYIVWLL